MQPFPLGNPPTPESIAQAAADHAACVSKVRAVVEPIHRERLLTAWDDYVATLPPPASTGTARWIADETEARRRLHFQPVRGPRLIVSRQTDSEAIRMAVEVLRAAKAGRQVAATSCWAIPVTLQAVLAALLVVSDPAYLEALAMPLGPQVTPELVEFAYRPAAARRAA